MHGTIGSGKLDMGDIPIHPSGCDVAPDYLECPLSRCKYDNLG